MTRSRQRAFAVVLTVVMLVSMLSVPLVAADDGGDETPDTYLGPDAEPVTNTTSAESIADFPDDPTLVYDAPTDDDFDISIDGIYAASDGDNLYFEITYDGNIQTTDDINTAIFLDTDQDPDTGLNSETEGWYYMADIGADYAAVVGMEGPGLWEWDPSLETWDESFTLDDWTVDTETDTARVSIDRDRIDDPGAIDFLVGNGGPNDEWAPPEEEGSLTFNLTAEEGDADDPDEPDEVTSIENVEQELNTTTVTPGETVEVAVTFDAPSDTDVAAIAFFESTFEPDVAVEVVEPEPDFFEATPLDIVAVWESMDATERTLMYTLTIPDDVTADDSLLVAGDIETADGDFASIPSKEITIIEEDADDGDEPEDGDDEDDVDEVPDEIPAGEAGISLTPTEATAVAGEEVTYEVILEGLDEGLSSYDITVGVSDSNVATVTDATVERESGFGDEVIADDNSSVQLERALGDETFEPTEEIVLGEVTIEAAEPSAEAEEPAVVDIEVTDANLNDLDSEPYDTVASDATLEVVEELPAPDVTGDGEPATDTTGDGLLNDIDGSGEFGINDVQLLFEKRNDDVIQDNAEQFDFTGTGDVGIADVQALFEQL